MGPPHPSQDGINYSPFWGTGSPVRTKTFFCRQDSTVKIQGFGQAQEDVEWGNEKWMKPVMPTWQGGQFSIDTWHNARCSVAQTKIWHTGVLSSANDTHKRLSRGRNKKEKQSHYRPGQALKVPGGWGSRNSSPTHRSHLPPRKYYWYSFLLEAESISGP